jgi:SAM-dependent methyltransferase
MTALHTMAGCPICDSGEARARCEAREMMFGLRDVFTYLECAGCGCVRLLDPPADLSTYYPPGYYSHRPPAALSRRRQQLRRRWNAHLLGRRNLTGALLSAVRRAPPLIAAVARTGIGPDDDILDVGSGVYGVLNLLHEQGYRSLTGVDPFIPADTPVADGFVIRRQYLAEVDGRYDLIIMNHSLEHMPDHPGTLRDAHRLLERGGLLLIRTPLAADSWREYGADWVELDAPRHLLVHSADSMAILAARTGFDIVDVRGDTTAFEIWGSIQYQQDIPLLDPRSHEVDPARSPFSRRQIRHFERRARELNRTGRAGRGSILLRRR